MFTSLGNHRSPDGFVVECDGAHVRAQSRSIAIVVTVSGSLRETNLEPVSRHVCRFAALDGPLIIDARHVDIGSKAAFQRLLASFSAQCRNRNVDWALVACEHGRALSAQDDGIAVAATVPEALQYIARTTRDRRNLLTAQMADRRSEVEQRPSPVDPMGASAPQSLSPNERMIFGAGESARVAPRLEEPRSTEDGDAQLHDAVAQSTFGGSGLRTPAGCPAAGSVNSSSGSDPSPAGPAPARRKSR